MFVMMRPSERGPTKLFEAHWRNCVGATTSMLEVMTVEVDVEVLIDVAREVMVEVVLKLWVSVTAGGTTVEVVKTVVVVVLEEVCCGAVVVFGRPVTVNVRVDCTMIDFVPGVFSLVFGNRGLRLGYHIHTFNRNREEVVAAFLGCLSSFKRMRCG